MTRRREVLILATVGLLAAGGGAVFGPRLVKMLNPVDPDVLRAAHFKDLSGRVRHIDEWKGRVLVVNFWATWCPPCREEIPALARVRNKLLPSGVEFLGIAIDQESKVSSFAKEMTIPYPILLADASGLDLMRNIGNPAGALPFTIILNRMGAIVAQHLGALTQEKTENLLSPLLSG